MPLPKIEKMLTFQTKRFRLDTEDVALSRRILDLAEQIKDAFQVADSRFALGFAYLFAGSISEAVTELSTALNKALGSGNWPSPLFRGKVTIPMQTTNIFLIQRIKRQSNDQMHGKLQ